MNKYEVKTQLLQINDSINFIDSQMLKLKVAFDNLEKQKYNVDEIKRLIDTTNIEFKDLKSKSREFIKEEIKN